MKKVMKRVITACLAFAMILALVTPASVEAATKNESLTLYKGETYTWYLTGVKSLSSASSTKKAVATVKANKSKKQYTISAKKAGTSVVTIKGKDYYGHTQSLKIKVTVAEPKFDLKLQKLDGNYILISLKNNTKATFDRIAVKYSLKDSSGSELAAKEEKVYRVMSGKTAYERIYVASAADVDISQSSVKITGFDRNPDQKYKVLGKDKLSVTVTDEQASDTRITFNWKRKNKTTIVIAFYKKKPKTIRKPPHPTKSTSSLSEQIKENNNHLQRHTAKKTYPFKVKQHLSMPLSAKQRVYLFQVPYISDPDFCQIP